MASVRYKTINTRRELRRCAIPLFVIAPAIEEASSASSSSGGASNSDSTSPSLSLSLFLRVYPRLTRHMYRLTTSQRTTIITPQLDQSPQKKNRRKKFRDPQRILLLLLPLPLFCTCFGGRQSDGAWGCDKDGADWERGKAHRRIKKIPKPQTVQKQQQETAGGEGQGRQAVGGAKAEEEDKEEEDERGPKTEPNGKWNGIESKRS